MLQKISRPMGMSTKRRLGNVVEKWPDGTPNQRCLCIVLSKLMTNNEIFIPSCSELLSLQNNKQLARLLCKLHWMLGCYMLIKVKESCNRPSVAQRVTGGLGSQISMTFGTWRWWGCQPHAPAAFTPQEMFLVLIFTRGWVNPRIMVRSEGICHWKIQDTTGNWSRDCPTSSAAP
jgi:hypothetical protein